jgi:hypothetical protein
MNMHTHAHTIGKSSLSNVSLIVDPPGMDALVPFTETLIVSVSLSHDTMNMRGGAGESSNVKQFITPAPPVCVYACMYVCMYVNVWGVT